jgi:hypothetical protein
VTIATRLVAANVDIKTVSAILGHSTSHLLLERHAHESEQAALASNPVPLGTFWAHRVGGAEGVARDRGKG